MDTTLAANPNALRIAGSLLLLTRTLDEHLRRASPQDELGLLDLSVMDQLVQEETLPSTVASVLRLQRGTVTRIVDRLVRSGYVERQRDRRDRRQCGLRLTASGRERLQRGLTDLSSLLSGLVPDLPGDLRTQLREGAERV